MSGWGARAGALAALPAFVVLLATACSSDAATDGPKVVLVREDARVDASPPELTVEVAASREQRAHGLSGRLEVPAGTGMLFVYREPGPREFWMKDCVIALDIAFLDAQARVLSVTTLPPGAGLPFDAIPRASEPGPVSYVLETAAGELRRLGVEVGDRVELGQVLAGVDPD